MEIVYIQWHILANQWLTVDEETRIARLRVCALADTLVTFVNPQQVTLRRNNMQEKSLLTHWRM